MWPLFFQCFLAFNAGSSGELLATVKNQFLLAVCCCALFSVSVQAAQRQLPTERLPAARGARGKLVDHEGKAQQAEKNGDWDSAAAGYRAAARGALLTGHYQEALRLGRKSLEAAERSAKPLLQTHALLQLVYVHNFVRQFTTSRTLLDKAIDLIKQVPRSPQRQSVEANVYREMGYLHYLTGEPRKAIDFTNQSLQIREAQLAFLKSRPPTPRTPRWLRAVQGSVMITLHHLGNSHRDAGDHDPALKAYERALSMARAPGAPPQAEIILNQEIGQLYLGQKDYGRAQEYLEKALASAAKAQPSFALERANSLLGELFLQTAKPAQAITHFRRAIDYIESSRSLLESEQFRSSFFDDKRSTYTGMILAQLANKNIAEAFGFNERARSRALLDLLGSKVQLSRGALGAEEKAVREQVSAARAHSMLGDDLEGNEAADDELPAQEADSVQKAYDDFLARVRQENQEQASLMNVEPLGLKEVQSLLDPQVSLIEYFVTQQELLVWIVEKDRLESLRISIARNDLVAKIARLRETLADPSDVNKFKTGAQELFRLLIEPTRKYVRGKELLIVPHDVLHYLPFQALVNAAGKYLLEEFSLRYLSSASLMRFTKEKTRAGRAQALVLGNPSLGDPAYDLRFAEREAREIAQLFPQSAVFIKEQATKPRAIADSPKYDMLHFATHAELNQEDPLDSVLRLARTPDNDGRLTAGDIFGFNLKADMVVLSACETGLGKITNGDEIIGLTRAFIYAGTPSVVTTLWKVNDRASYELIRRYYANLATMKKAEALRQAQLQTRKEFPHPFYWAAYTLTGES